VVGLEGKAELLTGIEGYPSRPVCRRGADESRLRLSDPSAI